MKLDIFKGFQDSGIQGVESSEARRQKLDVKRVKIRHSVQAKRDTESSVGKTIDSSIKLFSLFFLLTPDLFKGLYTCLVLWIYLQGL
jgi:hypothetical protein